MRAMAYVIAALAAVGIMIGIAMMPDTDAVPSQEPNVSAVASSSSESRVMDEAGTLVLSVPEMHCQYSCFPSVKKILEESTAVQGVELAAQEVDGTIDNRAVIVSYDAGFDLDAAIAKLGSGGFKESDLLQTSDAEK